MSEKLEACAEKLISERKSTKPPSEYPGKKDLSRYSLKNSVKGTSVVKGIDTAEDVVILVSRADNELVGLDFDGNIIFNLDVKGVAKFCGGTDKIFISGKDSGLYDL